MTTAAPPAVCAHLALGEDLEADASVEGAPEAADRGPCAHASQIEIEPLVAFVKEDPADDSSAVLGWQVRIRARCWDCDTSFSIDPASARPSRDGTGIVLTLAPTEEP